MNASRRPSASFRCPIEELLPYPEPPDEEELAFTSANPYQDYLRYMQRKAGARADPMEAAIRPPSASATQDGGYAAFMARYGASPGRRRHRQSRRAAAPAVFLPSGCKTTQ